MPTNIDKTYELRGLVADDMFTMFSIISKIGVKEFKGCFSSDEVKAAVSAMQTKNDENDEDYSANVVDIGVSVAFDVAGVVLANIGKCKNDIYTLLADLSGLNAGEVAKLPMGTFAGMVVDLVKKEEFADFFQGVLKLFK